MVSLHDNRRVTKSQGICCKEHSTSFGCFDYGWATENIWINQQWATARNAYFTLLSSATSQAFTTKYVFFPFFFLLLKCRLIRSRDYISCPSIIVGASYMGTWYPISGSMIIKGWKEHVGVLPKCSEEMKSFKMVLPIKTRQFNLIHLLWFCFWRFEVYQMCNILDTTKIKTTVFWITGKENLEKMGSWIVKIMQGSFWDVETF